MTYKTIKLDDSWNGKTLEEVKTYLEKEYPNQLATEADRDEYIKQNPNPDLPDWTWCYFFGSIVRDRNGRWGVPCAWWSGAAWVRDARWLTDGWLADFRVVLVEPALEPEKLEKTEPLDSGPLTLELRRIADSLERIEKYLKPLKSLKSKVKKTSQRR